MLGFIDIFATNDKFEHCHKYCTRHPLTTALLKWCERNSALDKTHKKRMEIIDKWSNNRDEATQQYVMDHTVCKFTNEKPSHNHNYNCTTLRNRSPSTFSQHLYNCHNHQPLIVQLFLLSNSLLSITHVFFYTN